MLYKISFSLFLLFLSNSCSSDDNETCPFPENPILFNIDENYVFVSWEKDNYLKRLHISPKGAPPPPTETFFFTALEFTVMTNLMPNTEYDLYLANDCGLDEFSKLIEPISFKTLNFMEGCTQPDSLIYQIKPNESIILNWEGFDESLWEITYGETGFFINPLTEWYESNSSHYTINNLDIGTTYDFYVRSKCGSLEYSSPRALLNVNLKE